MLTSVLLSILIILNLIGLSIALYTEKTNHDSLIDYLFAPVVLNVITVLFLLLTSRWIPVLTFFAGLAVFKYWTFQTMEGADAVWDGFRVGSRLGYELFYVTPTKAQSVFVSVYSFVQVTASFFLAKMLAAKWYARTQMKAPA
jgi:hypothetical protein